MVTASNEPSAVKNNFGSDENHNGEIYLNVKPTLNNLNLPNTKITYCDYSLFLGDPNNFSLIKDCGTEYYKEIGSFFSIHNLFWRDIYKYIEKTNKSTAIVFGEDKPNILPEGDGFCAFFRDMSFNEYGNFQQKDNYKKESFFITPDFPQLTIKQHHILMRLYEYMVKEHKVLPYDKNELTIERVLYKHKNPLQFISEKSKTKLLSARDQFILNNTDSEIYKIYRDAMKKMCYDTHRHRESVFFTRKYYLR